MHIYLYTYIQGSDSSHFVVNFLKKSLVFKWLSPQITRIFPSSRSSCASGTCRALLLAGTWELFCGDLLTETKEPSRGSKFAMCLWVCVWVCECVWVCTRLRVHPSTLAKLFFSPSFFFPCIFFLSVFLAPIFLLPLCAHVLTQQSALPPFPLPLFGSSFSPTFSCWLFLLSLFLFVALSPLPLHLFWSSPSPSSCSFSLPSSCSTRTAEGSFCGNTLQHTAPNCGGLFLRIREVFVGSDFRRTFYPNLEAKFGPGWTSRHTTPSMMLHSIADCNTLQHTATHCNTLHSIADCNTLQHTATHCNTLQHTATHLIPSLTAHYAEALCPCVWCICVMHMCDAYAWCIGTLSLLTLRERDRKREFEKERKRERERERERERARTTPQRESDRERERETGWETLYCIHDCKLWICTLNSRKKETSNHAQKRPRF